MNVEDSDAARKETFATALYHAFIDPRSFSDVDGRYTGADGKIHRTADFTYRTIFSGWDVFRSQYPLLTILRPDVVDDTVNSLIQQAELSGNGYLARWELLAIESGCMLGDPAISVFTDAYLKGIRHYDAEKAYALCRQTAQGPRTNRQDWQKYLELGYAPGSISNTLESAYFDYCAGRFAEALGKKDEAATFFRRAMNYRNIYDPAVGNMRAKDANGNWAPWKGATRYGQGCVESNPYQQNWFVPHDVQGLIDLMGKDYFLSYLTAFFEKTPASFEWNDYFNQANEPVHHVPYLFVYAGRPWLTQKWARFTMDHAYRTGVRGLCGDEDVARCRPGISSAPLAFIPFRRWTGSTSSAARFSRRSRSPRRPLLQGRHVHGPHANNSKRECLRPIGRAQRPAARSGLDPACGDRQRRHARVGHGTGAEQEVGERFQVSPAFAEQPVLPACHGITGGRIVLTCENCSPLSFRSSPEARSIQAQTGFIVFARKGAI